MKERLIRKFEGEIAALDRELKLELPKEIKRARELGDLRENAEYAAAKERQRLVEARISMLKKRVSEIAIMNVDRIPHDRAGFGSTVHVVESNGEKQVFQLVMPEDADAAKGLISTTSPLGRAFLNKEAGDAVKVITPGGNREFEIVKLIDTLLQHADARLDETLPLLGRGVFRVLAQIAELARALDFLRQLQLQLAIERRDFSLELPDQPFLH